MKDLFGGYTPVNPEKQPGKRLAETQHAQLIAIHGQGGANRCKDCRFLYVRKFGNKYFKCEKASQSGGPATDWRANWWACGLFEKSES
jgi:hypothetical protein